MSVVDDILASGRVEPVTEITSWLDGAPKGAVPISQGEVTETAGGDLLGQLVFTLPATAEWMPRNPGHALAPFGQELLVRRGFRMQNGDTVGWRILGRFRIRTTDPEDGWLTVTADSIDVRLTMARWIVETTTSGTIGAQVRQICAGIVPIIIKATDRSSPNRVWEAQTTRRESLLELLDAWGCVLRMIDGNLTVIPAPTGTTSDVTVTSGVGGTLVSATPQRLADPVTNVVVASSAPADEATPVVTAMAVTPSGPLAWDGPYGQVVTFYASPVITTIAQAGVAAVTRLARLQAKAPDVAVECVTDPRTTLDSLRRVIDKPAATDAVVRVVEVRHALTKGKEPGGFRGLFVAGMVEGPAITPAPPTSRARQLALRPVFSGTWAGSWLNTSALFQGRQWSGSTIAVGGAWYGPLPSNITSAAVVLTRGVAVPDNAVPTMRLLAGTTRPGGSGGTVVATATGPTLGAGESVTWPLPAGWVTHLNAGTAGGIGVGNGTATPYVGMSASGLAMTLVLTLTE